MVLVSNPAIQYMLYEQLLRILRRWKAANAAAAAPAPAAPKKAEGEGEVAEAPAATAAPVKLTPLEIFLASAAAKVGATIATYWLVVVKSRMQAGGKDSEFQYNGTWDALSTIYRQEGIGGFFKGLRSKILQTALNAALMLMLKEQVYSATKHLLSAKSVSPSLKSATAAVTRGIRS